MLSTSACNISEERLRGYCVRLTPQLSLEKFMSAFILEDCARLAHLREQKDPNPYFGRDKHLIISNESTNVAEPSLSQQSRVIASIYD